METINTAMRRMVLCAVVLLVSCGGGGGGEELNAQTTNVPLTPAANLAGNWRMTTALRMNVQTGNPPQNVGTVDWAVLWIVTPVPGNPNQVDIEMRLNTGNFTAAPGAAIGYVPLASPVFLRGTISSSAIEVRGGARDFITVSGSFTTNNMMLTWNRFDCSALICFGESSARNAFILTR